VVGFVLLYVVNDVDFGVFVEYMCGVVVGYDNVVFLMGDVGLGGGVIVDVYLLYGVGGYVGELGYFMVNFKGCWCCCGSVGCWEIEVCLLVIVWVLCFEDIELELMVEWFN